MDSVTTAAGLTEDFRLTDLVLTLLVKKNGQICELSIMTSAISRFNITIPDSTYDGKELS
jgi:hypothetical protein